jgi:autotransporter-associated beta strand protein
LRNSSSTALAPDIYYDPLGGTAAGYTVIIASNVDVGTGTRYINGKSNRNDYERYGGDLIFSGNLSGSANLIFTGTPNTGASGGPWQVAYVLAGNNSAFTGGIILTDGANLTLNNASALTSANTVTFTPGAGAVSGLYLYGRSVTIGALSGTAIGTMNIRNGSLVTDNNATINPGIVRSNAVLTVQQNTNTTFNGSISDGLNDHGAGDAGTYYTLGLTKTGTGTLTLGGTNSYTGVTTINGGTLQFAKDVSLYNNSSASWTATKIIVASGATAAFNVGGAGEFTSANIDTLKALGTASGGFKSGSILGLDTTNASGGSFTYSSVIANPNAGANVLGLTKLGSGTLVLTGANTYTGATTINSGTLLVNGSLASGSAVTVNNSGSILGGTGTINGSVSIASSGAILEAGTGSTGQTLTMKGAVTMAAGSIVQLALGASSAHSTLAIGVGGSISFQSLQKFNIIDLGVSNGSTYTGIITGIGADPGTESSWTIANQQAWTYNFSYDSASGGEIDLTVTAIPEPSTWIAAGLALAAIGYNQRKRIGRLRIINRRCAVIRY